MKTLKGVKIGETVRIVKVHGEVAVKRRIMDMGIRRLNLFQVLSCYSVLFFEMRISLG